MSGGRRRWDVAAQDPASIAAEALKAATAVLERKGISVAAADPFSQEININASSARYALTKTSTHSEIRRDTGAAVFIKGVYKSPGDTSSEKGLYLYVVADDEASLKRGVERIHQIMDEGSGPTASTASSSAVPSTAIIEKVYVGIDQDASPRFPLIGKILGSQGSYLKHISSTTSCRVFLRGAGTGREATSEPLHIWIQAPNQEAADSAKKLATDLLNTVRKDYEEYIKPKVISIAGGAGSIGGVGGGPHSRGYGPGPGAYGYPYQGYPGYGYGAYPPAAYAGYPAPTDGAQQPYEYPRDYSHYQGYAFPPVAPTHSNVARTPTSPPPPDAPSVGPQRPTPDDITSLYSLPEAPPLHKPAFVPASSTAHSYQPSVASHSPASPASPPVSPPQYKRKEPAAKPSSYMELSHQKEREEHERQRHEKETEKAPAPRPFWMAAHDDAKESPLAPKKRPSEGGSDERASKRY